MGSASSPSFEMCGLWALATLQRHPEAQSLRRRQESHEGDQSANDHQDLRRADRTAIAGSLDWDWLIASFVPAEEQQRRSQYEHQHSSCDFHRRFRPRIVSNLTEY